MKETLRGLLITGAEIATISIISSLAFTPKQRTAIIDRDQSTCQHPDPSICHSKELEVHHITPQRFGRAVLKMNQEDLDTEDNGITICRNHHRGHPNSIHPDAQIAEWEYQHGNKNAWAELMEERDRKVAEGKIYWNNQNDGILRAKAKHNNLLAKAVGWVFPNHNYRNRNDNH